MSGNDSEREGKGKAAGHDPVLHTAGLVTLRRLSHVAAAGSTGSAPSSGFLLSFPLHLSAEAGNAHPLCIESCLGSLEHGSTEMRAQTET